MVLTSVLTIDIGGSFLKAGMVDADGRMLGESLRCPAPAHPSPEHVLDAIRELTRQFSGYTAISIGFPGAIKRNIILTAPNLGTALWAGIDFQSLVEASFQCPVRLVNDATMHGLGIIGGDGIEVALTLGTGMGFALFSNGIPAPQIELGRHPAGDEPTYDDFVGDAALRRVGELDWKSRVQIVVERLHNLLNFDKLYLGGGNARLLSPAELPDNVILVTNAAGLAGGAKLWQPDIAAILAHKTR